MELIHKYFPGIKEEQKELLGHLLELYQEWNQKINVISRQDMQNFYERHVLHSLAISKVIQFKKNDRIIDVGTGGGFPGVPLAIIFPESQFILNDSIGKKLKVIDEIASVLDLKNIKTIHSRAEDINEQFDFIVSRAVTNLPRFIKITKHLCKVGSSKEKGLYYLKGGDFEEELKKVKKKFHQFELKTFFKEDFFDTKKIVHLSY